MEKLGEKVTEDDFMAALLKVKPTDEMTRQGSQPSRPKAKKPKEKPQNSLIF